MEKQFKPMPDIECLKYHGTPEKPDIKIFVSHRIDLDSETIDNPLYIPVRCGAVFDDRNDITMLGDDTGDNISWKREKYGELTVQYWAWKNVDADYYGLFHYRRYLSFQEKKFDICRDNNVSGLVKTSSIKTAIKHFKIANESAMRSMIRKYDVITIDLFDESRMGNQIVYKMMKSDFIHYDIKAVDMLLKFIEEKYPAIHPYAKKYFNQSYSRMYNLFIMKKKYFFTFCDFEFDILEKMEKSIDLRHANKEKQRLIGFLGEHLWGIFCLYLLETSNIRLKELQGIFCNETRKIEPIRPAFDNNNIAVVFSSSETFVPFLAVTLKSLIDCSKHNNNYDIIVLEKSISDYQKERLKKIIQNLDNFSLRFLNVSHMVAETHFYLANNNELSEETYYTILVPWVLENYRKAVVLDCDIIIKRDIADLFRLDIHDFYIAAAKEIIYLGFLNNPLVNVDDSLMKYTVKKLGLKQPFDYFQAGVLLINLVEFREKFQLKKLLREISNNKFNVVEQDLLNKICAGHVKFLDYAWNFMACISESTKPNLELAPKVEYELWQEASKNPFIYHYITGMKPWRYPNLQYAEEWWKVARGTEFYEIALSNLRIESVPILEKAIFDLQCASGFFDGRSGARKLADKMLPQGTFRRRFVKFLLPKGSLRWRFCKQIYYILKPQYRPVKPVKETTEEDE